jgi:hypothetical protein
MGLHGLRESFTLTFTVIPQNYYARHLLLLKGEVNILGSFIYGHCKFLNKMTELRNGMYRH